MASAIGRGQKENFLLSCLSDEPQVAAFLHAAKESPEDDAPRLVLADWLEDHGDSERAEFIRLDCTARVSAAGGPALSRREQLLADHGGAWLGPLWRWWLVASRWHRGLLSVDLTRVPPAEAGSVLPWVNTALFAVHGRRGLTRVVEFLSLGEPNHLLLDLRRPMREELIPEALGAVGESPCLRTLSLNWSVGWLRLQGSPDKAIAVPAPGASFLEDLLALPMCRHLTHLASWPAFSATQTAAVRRLGVEPVHARSTWWMHSRPSLDFARPRWRRTRPSALYCQVR